MQDGVHVLNDRQIHLELFAESDGGVAGVHAFGHHIGGSKNLREAVTFR